MSALDNLTKAITDVQAENAVVISTLQVVGLQVTTLKQQVADLQAAIDAAGNTDPAIQAAADALEAGLPAVQAAIDVVVPPVVTPPVEPSV